MKRKSEEELSDRFSKILRINQNYNINDSYESLFILQSGMGSLEYLQNTFNRFNSYFNYNNNTHHYENELPKLLQLFLDTYSNNIITVQNTELQIQLFQLIFKIDTLLIKMN
jgi:hypothetical protein